MLHKHRYPKRPPLPQHFPLTTFSNHPMPFLTVPHLPSAYLPSVHHSPFLRPTSLSAVLPFFSTYPLYQLSLFMIPIPTVSSCLGVVKIATSPSHHVLFERGMKNLDSVANLLVGGRQGRCSQRLQEMIKTVTQKHSGCNCGQFSKEMVL